MYVAARPALREHHGVQNLAMVPSPSPTPRAREIAVHMRLVLAEGHRMKTYLTVSLALLTGIAR
jgi:hypothetical protein